MYPHLVKQAPEQPAVFAPLQEYGGENCPHCSPAAKSICLRVCAERRRPLTQGWPGQNSYSDLCQCCTAYNTVFAATRRSTDHGNDGTKNALDAGGGRGIPLTSDQRYRLMFCTRGCVCRLFAAETIFTRTTFSGSAAIPHGFRSWCLSTCLTCAQTMMFLAQLSYEDIETEGMLYGFYLPLLPNNSNVLSANMTQLVLMIW